MFCLGGALFGALILLPLYFQTARGMDAITTGLLLIPQGIGTGIGMNRSAAATSRLGAGLTSLYGGMIMVIATIPFLFIGDSTSYVLIGVTTLFRGIGIGLAFMPAMTAAYSALSRDQINDASPQLNVIQRVGGSFGTAIIAVVLQSKLSHLSHPTSAAVAGAFAQTYWWVIALTAASLIPAAFLWRVERRAGVAAADAETHQEAMMDVLA
jgi:hypothetical protein